MKMDGPPHLYDPGHVALALDELVAHLIMKL